MGCGSSSPINTTTVQSFEVQPETRMAERTLQQSDTKGNAKAKLDSNGTGRESHRYANATISETQIGDEYEPIPVLETTEQIRQALAYKFWNYDKISLWIEKVLEDTVAKERSEYEVAQGSSVPVLPPIRKNSDLSE